MADGMERELIAQFKAGDESAVRAIVAEYRGPIQTIARSMIGSPELAAEVVQQTFVKAWKSAASFDEDRAFAPWIYSIARRTAIDALRREGRRPPVVADEQHVEVADDGLTFERAWQIFEVRRALDALPDDERSVMKMSHLLGMTHQQISDELGIPVGTVKSRTDRARKRLVAALRHVDPGANHSDPTDVQDVGKHP